MSDGGVQIVKVGHTPPPATRKANKAPKHGILKGGKTARKTPRFEGVKDPAKSPPVTRKTSLRILTEKGLSKRRKTLKKQVDDMPIDRVRSTLRKAGLPISDKTPEHLVRDIAVGGMEAGMIS